MVDTRVYPEVKAASWGAIFAGAVTALAVSVTLGFLGVALGFGAFDGTSSTPFAGVGTAFGLSSAVVMLVALAAGGFVAGRLAGQDGLIHGLVSWGLALLFGVVISVWALTGAARTAASTAGTVAGGVASATGTVLEAAGSAVGGLAGGAADAVGGGADALAGLIDDTLLADVDFGTSEAEIRTALANTEIETLQPAALEAELAAAREDIAAAGRALVVDPGQWDVIARDLAQDLGARAEAVVTEIDRQEVINTLVANTDLTPAEAAEATDNAIAAYAELSETVQTGLVEAEARISTAVDEAEAAIARLQQEAQAALEEAEAEARRIADEAAAAATRAALWSFVAAALGAAVAGAAGLYGARSRYRVSYT